MAEQLYQIVDEFPFQEKVTTYHNLTLEQAAVRMDDLIDVSEQTILEDWGEPCEGCGGTGEKDAAQGDVHISAPCSACGGDGKWAGPWEHTDEETGREVTMTRALQRKD
jgi:DnaJ-class molecular chaperone